MAYAQDTIISANASNALATAIHNLLTTAGWSVVETLNPAGTNTPINRVYKSAGTSNAAGYDWYLAMMWKTVGTESWLQLIPGGAYDIATHTITQIPVALTHDAVNRWADFATGDQWGGFNVNVATVSTGNVTPIGTGRGTSQNRSWFATIVPSSAFGYWASVTLDHIALFTTIASTNGPFNFIASTLDVVPEWSSQTFGNGVATNPVVMFFGAGTATGSAPTTNAGISVAIKGSNNGVRIGASQRVAGPVGASLPVLTGPWLPAFAWRPAFYQASAATQSSGTGTDPTWDFPLFGDGFHIGDGIDYWQVRGGSIGDTVEIEGATYVLSGAFNAGVVDTVSFAVPMV